METQIKPRKQMKLDTKAVHAGDRKRTGSWVPVTTPIHLATTYSYDDAARKGRHQFSAKFVRLSVEVEAFQRGQQ